MGEWRSVYDILRALGIRTNGGEFYRPAGNVYVRMSFQDLIRQLRLCFSQTAQGDLDMGEIVKKVKLYRSDPYCEIVFADHLLSNITFLRNGVFDLQTGRLETGVYMHGDGSFSFSNVAKFPGDFVCPAVSSCVIDANYIPKEKRKMPNFDRFIRTSFPERFRNDPETKACCILLFEEIGCCIFDVQLKKAFFFIGESNSGKSVMLEFLKRLFFPQSVVSNINLDDIGSKFQTVGLVGKKLNISSEFSPDALQRAMLVFKKVTSGEIVTVERKFEQPEEALLRCKFISAGNEFPKLRATGLGALLNRMVVLIFPRSIPQKDQDPELLEKLWMERDSIVSEIVDVTRDLYLRKFAFTEPMSTKKYMSLIRESDPSEAIRGFITEGYVLHQGGCIRTVELFNAFDQYLKLNGISCQISHNEFTMRVQNLFLIEKKRMRIDGGNYQAYVGIREKTNDELSYTGVPFLGDMPDQGILEVIGMTGPDIEEAERFAAMTELHETKHAMEGSENGLGTSGTLEQKPGEVEKKNEKIETNWDVQGNFIPKDSGGKSLRNDGTSGTMEQSTGHNMINPICEVINKELITVEKDGKSLTDPLYYFDGADIPEESRKALEEKTKEERKCF